MQDESVNQKPSVAKQSKKVWAVSNFSGEALMKKASPCAFSLQTKKMKKTTGVKYEKVGSTATDEGYCNLFD